MTDKGFLTSSTTGEGLAGNIALTLAQTLHVTNGGAISASTAGSGPGGTIAISADSVLVSGAGQFNSPDEDGSSVISSQTSVGGGNAGNLDITARTVDVFDGAHIAADTFGAGQGGNITITGERIQISGANEALRSALSQIPSISDKTVDLAPRSSITASTSGTLLGPAATGQGGNVQLTGGIVHIADGGLVTSGTTSGGTGGSVSIGADHIALSDDARVSAESSVFPEAGPAGTILMTATGIFEAQNSKVTRSAEQAAGGDVTITAGQGILLTDSTAISAQSQGPGNAGDILLERGGAIQMMNSAVTTVAEQADGGNIKLAANTLIHLVDSDITSSVGGGLRRWAATSASIPNSSFCKTAGFWPTPSKGRAGTFPSSAM